MLLSTPTKSHIFISSSRFTIQVLKGIGQIMLQENALTGLLFLIGIGLGSIHMGLGALLATVCGTGSAILLKFEKKDINSGIYGFSAALVGVAVMLFFKPVLLSWLLVCIGAVAASTLQHFFIQRKIPAFTLPFVVVTWCFILFAKYCVPNLLLETTPNPLAPIDTLAFAIKGFGQVIFQEKIVSGLLFFIAVYINSPSSALLGLVASVFSGLIAHLFQLPLANIEMGLWSYNAVLCAIALGGLTVKDGLWILAAVLIAIIIQLFMAQYHLIALTFPFVAATCMTLFFKNKTSL